MNISVECNQKGIELMKETLIKVYGNDIDVFNNMNIYTPIWATRLKSLEKADNGFYSDTIDEWVSELSKHLDNVPYIVFLDHVKYDSANIKRELQVNFV